MRYSNCFTDCLCYQRAHRYAAETKEGEQKKGPFKTTVCVTVGCKILCLSPEEILLSHPEMFGLDKFKSVTAGGKY